MVARLRFSMKKFYVIRSFSLRQHIRKYDLKNRIYLGPTSLDHALAFLMANLALVRGGMMVLDPFVGTGSILVALGHFGAFCMGTDIDIRVLKGEMYAGTLVTLSNFIFLFFSVFPCICFALPVIACDLFAFAYLINSGNGDRSIKRGIFENFDAYKLPAPDLIRMDNHLFDRHILIGNSSLPGEGVFEAIVTDPPYGIRAGAKKSGETTPAYWLAFTFNPPISNVCMYVTLNYCRTKRRVGMCDHRGQESGLHTK